MTEFALTFPPELVEAIAQRAAEIALERLDERGGGGEWGKYLTPEQAARYIGASTQRIYDLRSRKRLKSYGDGGRALVERSELDAYVTSSSPQRGRHRSRSRAAT